MYAIVLATLAGVGVVDLISRIELRSFRELIFDLRMFFVSPAPFVVMLLLSRWMQKLKVGDTPHTF